MTINPGTFVKVPTSQFGTTRNGPRYIYAYGIVKEIYQAKGGPAIEVAYVNDVTYKVSYGKFLVKDCKFGKIAELDNSNPHHQKIMSELGVF